MHTNDIDSDARDAGTFEITSGQIVAVDPCYGAGDGIRLPARNGTWYTRHHIEDGRCAALVVRAVDRTGPLLGWTRLPEEGGVDSGQFGFYDATAWAAAKAADSLAEEVPFSSQGVTGAPWYVGVCRTTCDFDYQPGGVPQAKSGGTCPGGFGTTSGSGWGDGGYPVFAQIDTDGIVVALAVVYMEDGDEDEDEDGDGWTDEHGVPDEFDGDDEEESDEDDDEYEAMCRSEQATLAGMENGINAYNEARGWSLDEPDADRDSDEVL